jgi:hypothetical protein
VAERLRSLQQWICELLLKNQQTEMGTHGMKELEPRENEGRNVSGIRGNRWMRASPGMFNRFAVFTTMLCAAVVSSTPNLQAQKSHVKNIVLVHGAWADGSAGGAFMTTLSGMASKSASSKSRRRPSMMM